MKVIPHLRALVCIGLCALWGALDALYAEDRIKVGAILPMSGEFASFGSIILSGIKQADSTGVDLIVEDDACSPTKTLSAYRKLTDIHRVSYILGPVCGSSQQLIAPLTHRSSQVAMLVGSGTANLYETSHGRMFSSQYSIEQEARFNAHYLEKLGVKRVAMVFFEDIFCRKHEEAFRESFKGSVVDTLSYSTFDSSEIKPIVSKLLAVKPDALYVPDATPFLLGLRRELSKVGLGGLPIVSIYSAQSDDILKAEGPAAEGLYYSYPAIPEPDAINYFPRIAAEMLFAAIGRCKVDTECVRKTLQTDHNFDEVGVLRGRLEMRTIKEGRFIKVAQDGTDG